MFIDKIDIYVRAGDGGAGAVSFRREKYVPYGGPDGGDGGRGGNIVFVADPSLNTLLAFRYRKKFIAENGAPGRGSKLHGKNGADVIIKVPYGTLIIDKETGKIIKDMSDEEPFVLCRGGRGGWGNRRFATPTRQAPNFAKSGTKGEAREVTLELKMLADVGLIGYPSVGKSSILARISAARPKIADYHFTTPSPNLGVVRTGEDSGFVAADIPGLIEGASEGAGLGHEFLRHIERCRLLLHVVDVSGSEGRDPVEDLRTINRELAGYSAELACRPQIIVANKTDLIDRESADLSGLEAYVSGQGYELIYISAATGENIDRLVRLAAEKLKELPPPKIFVSEYQPEDAYAGGKTRQTIVRRENEKFVVEGEWLINLLGQVNLSDWESLNFFQRVLRKSGVFRMLEEAGCRDGDTVSIYDYEFDYIK